jgi:O-antigen/teichoic acid export membrane protein
MRLPRKFLKFGHLELKYVYSGFSSSIIAAIFSILYSRDLGAQNRGIVTAVLLVNLFFASVLSGGVNISYKSHRGEITAQSHFHAFVRFSVLLVIVTPTLVGITLLLYSTLKTPIPTKLLILSIIYSASCGVITQINQILISFSKISSKLLFDLLVVALQPALYYSLKVFLGTSSATAVLLSLTLSYAVVSIMIVLRLKSSRQLLWNRPELGNSVNLANLIRKSKSIRSFSILTAIADRIDRIIVLILFSPSQFGVYTFAIGFIAFFRFVPDALSTLIMSKNTKLANYLEARASRLRIILLLATFTIAAILLSKIIVNYMGQEWKISAVTLAFCFYGELLRGIFIVKITPYFTLENNKTPARSVICVIIITLAGLFISIGFLGILSVPVSLFLGYLITIVGMQRFWRI